MKDQTQEWVHKLIVHKVISMILDQEQRTQPGRLLILIPLMKLPDFLLISNQDNMMELVLLYLVFLNQIQIYKVTLNFFYLELALFHCQKMEELTSLMVFPTNLLEVLKFQRETCHQQHYLFQRLHIVLKMSVCVEISINDIR